MCPRQTRKRTSFSQMIGVLGEEGVVSGGELIGGSVVAGMSCT